MMIRDATEADCDGILKVWNWLIRDTMITFRDVEHTRETLLDTLRKGWELNRPFFVAETDQIVGFASYTQFRASPGYRHTMEHSIALLPDAWGKGAGRGLMEAIFAHGRAHQVHSLFAGVSGANPAGVPFHEKLGFKTLGTLPEVGYKNGEWLDLVLMQKFL